MPWKETRVLDEKIKFIARLRDGDGMSELCREFGISRKTGYKLARRFELEGLNALSDRSRRPERLANLTDPKVQRLIVDLRQKRPTWGASKLLARLRRDHPEHVFPSRITVHNILARHGLVIPRARRRKGNCRGTVLAPGQRPNELWCADHKGQFLLGSKKYCYPLTISDHCSRFLLALDGLPSTKGQYAKPVFQMAFEEFGLPERMRTDNGPPFASSKSLFNLSTLSVWWMRLGISIERIEPGHPEQNGRHERIHLNIEKELVCHARDDFFGQQECFELWREDYNTNRPHEALSMKTPSEVYTPSSRPYPAELPEPDYSNCDKILPVTHCGSLCYGNGRRVFLSEALCDQTIGLKEEEDDFWSVRFMDLELGYLDTHEGVFHRGDSELGLLIPGS